MSRSGYAEPMVAWIIGAVRLLIVLASQHRSLALENLALRQQLAVYRRTRPKPMMRWADRLFWMGLRAAWRDWKSALVVVRPATVVAWHRRGFAWYWTCRSRPRGGRPRAGAEIRRLVREMAVANPLWGAPRIHGELVKLGFEVSERTVSRLMPRPQKPPSQSWRTFLKNHLDSTVAVDFFAVPTLTCRILFVFVVLAHDRRRILHLNVTRHPTSAWARQQLRETFSENATARFLLHDGDATFDAAFGRAVEAFGLTSLRTAPSSPWQKDYASYCTSWG
jgi:putative transposase